MPIKTLEDKMLHELRDIYDAEHQFLDAQQQMIKQANSQQVKTLLQDHIKQTEQQIKNLEQIFQQMDQEPRREKCSGASGIVSEGQKLLKQVQGPELIDLAIAGAQAKVEHYEIASYRGLITAAEQMGQQDALKLLQQNLQQEEQTAQRVEQSTPQLIQQAMSSRSVGE